MIQQARRAQGQQRTVDPLTPSVNKHLERIYVKLGGEKRASAAGLAIVALSDR